MDTVQHIGPSSTTSAAQASISFPFPFTFINESITTYSVAVNGIAGLNFNATTGNNIVGGTGNRIGAFVSGTTNAATHTTGFVASKVVGVAPNRCLVIQWTNIRLVSTSTTADATWQLRFYEGTNAIEMVYGNMNWGAGSSTSVRTGFSTSTSAYNQVLHSTHANSTSTSHIQTYNVVGPIANLNGGGTATTRRFYRFSPPVMTCNSSNTVQITGSATAGSSNNAIIRLTVNTAGSSLPISLSAIAFSLNGTTALSDVSSVRVFYTGAGTTFSTTTPFGSAITPATGTLNAIGSQTLLPGDNQFWVAFSLSPSAVSGNLLDAEIVNLTVNATVQAPTTGAPVGTREVVAPLAAGIYTVGGGGQYSTLRGAFNAINAAGISGNVTFNIISDVTDTLPALLNSVIESGGSGYTVTIRPSGGARTYTSTVAGGTIVLNGADRVIIDGDIAGSRSLTIRNTSGLSNSAAVFLSSPTTSEGCREVTVRNTILDAGVNTVTSNFGLIAGGATITASTLGSNHDRLTIQNNRIRNAYTGIYARCTLTALSDTLIIQENSIGDAVLTSSVLFRGIDVQGSTAPLIERNTIENMELTTSVNIAAIDIGANTTGARILANRVNEVRQLSTSGYGAFGINLNGGNDHQVINNLITNIRTLNYSATSNTFNAFALRITAGTNHLVAFNTLEVRGDYTNTNVAIAGAAPLTITVATVTATMRNNIMVNAITTNATGNKALAIMWLPASYAYSNLTIDNNAYFYGAQPYYYFAQLGTTFGVANQIANFGTWQTTSSGDGSSVFSDPLFSPTYQPGNAALNNIGTPISGITTDFNGVTRNPANPDPGAIEFTPIPEDIGVVSLLGVSNPCPGSSANIRAVVRNFGTATVNTFSASFTVNNGTPVVGSFSVSIASGASDTVTIGSFNFATFGTYTIRAYTSNPNGAPDANNSNDTLSSTVNTAYQGSVYTVGGVGANFPTLASAATALSTNGVCGSITLNVNPSTGPYVGQVAFVNVQGTSATNTIWIVGNNAVVTHAPLSTDLGVIKIQSSNWIFINNLQIVSTATSASVGVMLALNSNNNEVDSCTIDMSAATATSNVAGVAISASLSSITTAGTSGSNNLIRGNTILGSASGGAADGITLTGATGGLGCSNNLVADNIIQNVHRNGILLTNASNTTIRGNTISRAQRTNITTFGGIFLQTGGFGNRIEANRIHNPCGGSLTSTSALYPLYISSCDAPVGQENVFANNLVYNINGNGLLYGIYNIGSDGTHFYHNTISLDVNTATAGITRGFFQTTAASNIDFRNNIVTIARGGTGAKHAIYIGTTTSSIIADYNVYLLNSSGTGTQQIGFYSTAFNTLVDWQTANSGAYDQNSIVANPGYVNAATGILIPTTSPVNDLAQPLASVPTDFAGATRSGTPDPGAYEFEPISTDVALTSVSGVPSGLTCTPTGAIPISFGVTNTAINAVSLISATLQVTGAASQTLNGTYTSSLGSGNSASFGVGSLNNLPGGQYSYTAFISVAGDGIPQNDTLKGTFAITQRQPKPVVASTITTCPGDSVLLSASGASAIEWFSDATLSTKVSSTNSYQTPAITAPTRYYVTGDIGVSSTVGKTIYSSISSTSGASWGLVFNVTGGPARINTVDVFATSGPGTISVQLTDNAGNVLQTVGPFTIPAGGTTTVPLKVELPLNLLVNPGTGYRLLSTAMSGANLVRETSGNVFPYSSPGGEVVITSGFISGTSNTYYWFYNWKISTASGCPGIDSVSVSPITTVGIPSNLGVTNTGTNGTTLLWDACVDSTITGYQIWVSGGIGVLSVGNVKTFNLTGLASATTYQWSVRSNQQSISSAWVQGSPFTTGGTNPCTNAPTGTSETSITTTSATLNWNPVTGINTFQVWVTGRSTVTVTGNSYVVTGLSPGTNYRWSVRALCSGGLQSPDALDNFTTTGASACVAPNGLNAAYSNPTSTFNWNPVSIASPRYQIWIQGIGVVPSFLTSNTYATTAIANGATVTWTVRTVCGGGVNSAWASPNSIFTAARIGEAGREDQPGIEETVVADRMLAPAKDSWEVSLYPNPFNGRLTIVSDAAPMDRVEILDAKGSVVLTLQADQQHEVTYDIHELPAGMYVLKAYSPQGVTVQRLMRN